MEYYFLVEGTTDPLGFFEEDSLSVVRTMVRGETSKDAFIAAFDHFKEKEEVEVQAMRIVEGKTI